MVTSQQKDRFGGVVERKEKIIQVARNPNIRKKISTKMKMTDNNRKKIRRWHSRTRNATAVNKKVMRLKTVQRTQITKHLVMMRPRCSKILKD
jgi:hypothetical protein